MQQLRIGFANFFAGMFELKIVESVSMFFRESDPVGSRTLRHTYAAGRSNVVFKSRAISYRAGRSSMPALRGS